MTSRAARSAAKPRQALSAAPADAPAPAVAEDPAWLADPGVVVTGTGPWRSWDARLGEPGPWHVRHDQPDGSKTVTWRADDGTPGLGGHQLEDLVYVVAARLPDHGTTVVVTEGEKAADAVAAAGIDAIGTVCGAASQPGPAVMALLATYDVILSADHDDVGRAHMTGLATALEEAEVERVRWIEPPDGVADHWDLADVDAQAIAALVSSARELPIVPTDVRRQAIETLRETRTDVAGGPSEGSTMRSAAPAAPSGRNHPLRFRTPAEILGDLPSETEWLCRGCVPFGALVELVGQAKAAGKTTLLAHLIRTVVEGEPFLGQPTTQTPVVLLTEQPPASLRAVLERAGLAERDDVRILLWAESRGVAWADVVAAAVAECQAIGARLLIVDTLPAFAGMRGEAENDAGAALAAIEPLQVAAASLGLAVIVVRHERKAAGLVGESGRGSSAFTGAVDVVLRLARQQNPVRPTIRVIEGLSRFDETPDELVIELTDAGYVSLGSEAAVAYGEIRAALLELLPEQPAEGLTMAELESQVDGKRTTIQAALRELVDTGRAERHGGGRKGDPYRFRREPIDSAGHSAANVNGSGSNDPGFLSAGGPPLQGETHTGQKRRSRPGPASVGSEMATIFRPADDDEPDDLDEPEDLGAVVAEIFADLPPAGLTA